MITHTHTAVTEQYLDEPGHPYMIVHNFNNKVNLVFTTEACSLSYHISFLFKILRGKKKSK